MSNYPHHHVMSTREQEIAALVAADPDCEGEETCPTMFAVGELGWLECSLPLLHAEPVCVMR